MGVSGKPISSTKSKFLNKSITYIKDLVIDKRISDKIKQNTPPFRPPSKPVDEDVKCRKSQNFVKYFQVGGLS